jgi:hypothetical protein
MLSQTFLFFPFVFGWGITALLIIPYFLPTIIAIIRRSSSTGGIFMLNFFLGWTFIGWIASLIWAITSRNNSTVIVNNIYQQAPGQPYAPPPPYTSEPARPTHQTSPTLRRSAPTQSDASDMGR